LGPPGKGIGREGIKGEGRGNKAGRREGREGKGRKGKGKAEGLTVMKNFLFQVSPVNFILPETTVAALLYLFR